MGGGEGCGVCGEFAVLERGMAIEFLGCWGEGLEWREEGEG